MDTNSDQKSINLTLNFGDDVGDTGEGARGGRPSRRSNGQPGPLPPPTSKR